MRWVLWVLGCGSQPSAAPPPVEPLTNNLSAAETPPPVATGPIDLDLLDSLEAAGPFGPLSQPHQSLANCPDPVRPFTPDSPEEYEWLEGCGLVGAVVHDASANRWVVFVVDFEPEGPPLGFRFVALTANSSELILEGAGSPAELESARQLAASFSQMPAVDNLVIGRAMAEFPGNTYVNLVALGGSLEGQLLYVDTSELDEQKYRLWLTDLEGNNPRLIREMPAPVGPCDGDGYWCESSGGDCDDEGLRAEGRLCVLPYGIAEVAFAAGTLFVRGYAVGAGHNVAPSVPPLVIELPSGG